MIRVVILGGPPGAGKTTAAIHLLRQLGGMAEQFSEGLVRGTLWHEAKIAILGVYDGRACAGTDALSMAAGPAMVQWIRMKAVGARMHGWGVFAEGDRIFNGSLLQALKEAPGVQLSLRVIDTPENVRRDRLVARGSTQSDAWRRGRETKCRRLVDTFKIGSLDGADELLALLKGHTP